MTNPTNNEIRSAFKFEYADRANFMTQVIHSYGYSLKDHNLFFEITWDRGLLDGTFVVGTTFIHAIDGKCRNDLNKCFVGTNKNNLLSLAREYAEAVE